MKLKIKLSLVFFIVLNIFSVQEIFSQCFQIESILVDACGPEEGYNEMVRFKVGNSPLNVSNLDVNWPTNALTWQGVAPNSLTTAKLATLNAGILAAGGCGKLLQPTGGVLPANSIVVLVTSYKLDIAFNFFGAISEGIYIIFQDNDTASGGHFGNYGTGGATDLRFLDISFGSCTDAITYNRTLLIDEDGNKKAGDGASVNYTPSGVATYVNIGCNAPVEVFDVNAGSSPIAACQGATVSLSGTAQGQQSVSWSDGGKGGIFSAQNNLITNYEVSPTATGTITLTLTATNSCVSSKSSDIILNVNTKVTPTFNAIPTVCQNAIPPKLPTSSTNVPPIIGTWNAVVNTSAIGTVEYTFTPNANQCGTTTKLTVAIESCGFGAFASAGWLANCNFPNGQFYNITGSGVDLINPTSPADSFITNLGSFVQNSGALTFGGGEIKTFKTPTGNVCGATMFYNVHLQSDAAGTFTPLPLQFFSDCNSGTFNGGGPCKDRDQKWQTVTSGLLDMTILSSGNYVLEVYYAVNGDSDSNSQCDDTKLINNNGLNYRSSFSILGAPQYASTNPTTCTGSEGTITISGLLANTNYTLSYKDDTVAVGPTNITSNATGVFIISGLNAGSYTDLVVKADCGSYTNNTPIVLINPSLIASFSKTDNSVCQSPTVPCNGSATVTANGSGSYSYLWNDTLAQTTATATVLCPGNYNVLITDLVSLCTADLPITVGNTAVLPSITSVTKGISPICSGSNASFTINGTPNATVSYSINTNPTQTVVLNASGNALVTINQVTSDTTILLSQISLSSCSDTVTNTETVVVSSPPNAGNLSGDPVICSSATTTFASTVAGGVWSSSNNSIATIDATSGEIEAVSSGTATMTYSVAGTGGCTNEATAIRLVTISSTPIVSITAGCIDKEYILKAFPEIGVTYKWFKVDVQLTEISSEFVVKTPGSYTVEINNSGCTAQASVEVTSFYCEIPKGISPNGDEFNEYFDLSNRNVNKLEIFNRYGVKVYSKTNYKKEWDGKSDGGQELPDATYYYVIEEEGNAPITGWVYINR